MRFEAKLLTARGLGADSDISLKDLEAAAAELLKSKPAQGFYHMTTNDNLTINQSSGNLGKWVKPRNCFWAGEGFEWIRWLIYEMPEWLGTKVYHITIPQAGVLVVDSQEKVRQVSQTYGSREAMETYIDWDAVRSDYQTGCVVRDPRATGYSSWPYNWDISSVAIWGPGTTAKMAYQYDTQTKQFIKV